MQRTLNLILKDNRILAPILGLAIVTTAFDSHAQRTNCIEITCPRDIVVECDSPEGARVFFSATATNHCGGRLNVTAFPRSGSIFPMGTIAVRVVATDGATATNGCSFTVTVRDTTPPEIFCPPEIRVPCSGRTGAIVNYRIGAADNCDTNATVTCNPPSGSLFPIGTNIVTCSARDGAGNESRCTFPVVVESGCTEESDCIVIECPQDIVEMCDSRVERS